MKRLLEILDKKIKAYEKLIKIEKAEQKETDNVVKLFRLQKIRKVVAFDRDSEYCTHCLKELSEDIVGERKFSDFNNAVHDKRIKKGLFFASNGERLCEKHWNKKLNGKLGSLFNFEEKKKKDQLDLVV